MGLGPRGMVSPILTGTGSRCTMYRRLAAVAPPPGVSLGVTITFLPLHFLGYSTQPRRAPEYPDIPGGWGTLSSLGSGVTLLSLVAILYPGPGLPPYPTPVTVSIILVTWVQ